MSRPLASTRGPRLAGYTKRAVKCGPTPGTYHLNCECGAILIVDYPHGENITCPCGIRYDARGWIVSRATVAS
jgi:hypothetical protein